MCNGSRPYEKDVILNIANEWGPNTRVWVDAYKTAVARLRAAGINCLLMIDTGGTGGQDNDSMMTWWREILDSDPQKNIVFSVHMYGYWVTEDGARMVGSWDGRNPRDIKTELTRAVDAGIPFVVGEFSWEDGDVSYTTHRAMEIFQSLDVGWLAWSWNQNAPAFPDMLPNNEYRYTSDGDLTKFGDMVINDPVLGLKATSRRATIFPAGVTVTPTTGLETTEAGGTAAFTVVLNSPPTSDVTIALSSSDATEATITPEV